MPLRIDLDLHISLRGAFGLPPGWGRCSTLSSPLGRPFHGFEKANMRLKGFREFSRSRGQESKQPLNLQRFFHDRMARAKEGDIAQGRHALPMPRLCTSHPQGRLLLLRYPRMPLHISQLPYIPGLGFHRHRYRSTAGCRVSPGSPYSSRFSVPTTPFRRNNHACNQPSQWLTQTVRLRRENRTKIETSDVPCSHTDSAP